MNDSTSLHDFPLFNNYFRRSNIKLFHQFWDYLLHFTCLELELVFTWLEVCYMLNLHTIITFQKKVTDERTDWRTEWVTMSLLELLIAAKNLGCIPKGFHKSEIRIFCSASFSLTSDFYSVPMLSMVGRIYKQTIK